MDWDILILNLLRRISDAAPQWIVGSGWWARLMARVTERHGMESDSKYFRMIADIKRWNRDATEEESEFIRNWWKIRYPEIRRRAERHRSRQE